MSKRFTDPSKWEDEWFMALPPAIKCAWQYLCDHCDSAGVWKINLKLMGFKIGAEITEEALRDHLGDRVAWLGSRIWIVGYIPFHYRALDTSRNASHRGIARALLAVCEGVPLRGEAASLVAELRKSIGSAIDSRSPLDQESTDSQSTLQYIKINTNSSDSNRTKRAAHQHERNAQDLSSAPPALELVPSPPAASDPIPSVAASDLEAAYQLYPRKEGKRAGLARAAALIRSREDYEQLLAAIDRYSKHCKKTGQMILHFSTFIQNREQKPYFEPWRDWTDPEAGQVLHAKAALYSDAIDDSLFLNANPIEEVPNA